jgi:outer membrane receptor protein involved in Fe transport
VTASIEYEFPVMGGVTADVRAEDIFRGGNPGPSVEDNPASPFHDPGSQPDPSTNLLNLRANVRWETLDLSLFVNNALDSRPILNSIPGIGCCRLNAIYEAYTLTPRTVGVSTTWRF